MKKFFIKVGIVVSGLVVFLKLILDSLKKQTLPLKEEKKEVSDKIKKKDTEIKKTKTSIAMAKKNTESKIDDIKKAADKELLKKAKERNNLK